MKCEKCGSQMSKVIYMGFPMRLCESDLCGYRVAGFWSWVTEWHFNGIFWGYEGSYFPALWDWLFAPTEYD